MATLTLSHFLGMLQEDPDDEKALEGLLEVVTSEDPARRGVEPLRLMEAARHGHQQRGEWPTVGKLLELETELAKSDPDREAQLWKDLARVRREELLDDKGARSAFEKVLALRPGDTDAPEQIEQIDQVQSKWKDIAKRYADDAEAATDATLKSSLLARAAVLVWQFKKKGRDKDVDGLFGEALEADPSNTRAASYYEITLRDRSKWNEVAQVLVNAADAARNREERLNLFVRAGRVIAKKLNQKERATACYERVLDLAPGHPEAMRWLAEYFTEREMWDHLVALYEDALRSRQKLESEQGILLQVGMVHWRMRGKPEDAEPYFARLRKIDPSHPAMVEFYRDFLAKTGDDARLVTILADAQRTASTPDAKLRLAIEVARAAQGNPATTERAIDAWKAVQRLEPHNADAVAALKDLYTKTGKWNALVDVLKADLEGVPESDPQRRVAILREMVPIYREKLSLDVMVINTYNAILQILPDDAEALSTLAATYEHLQRWNDLIQVLTKQAAAATDPPAKVALYMRVANLWIARFTNYNQATTPLEQVIAVEPDNREALALLKDIYGKKRAWKQLYDVMLKESELASDPTARLAMQVELAKLAAERLHKNTEAMALWKEVLKQDPHSPGALDALEKLAEREKDWGTLADALELRLTQTADTAERIKVLQKIGGIFAPEQMNEPQRAARAWKRVLELDPKNGRAMRTLRETFLQSGDWAGLEQLYGEAGDWEGLVDVLGSAADRSTDAQLKVKLSFRAAELYETQIGEPTRAFRSYERVLAADPMNVRAAQALVGIYEKEEKWSRLVPLLEVLLRSKQDEDVDGRLALLARLRDVSLNGLRDADSAFRWAAEAYGLSPTDTRVRDAMESAAEKASAWAPLVKAYEARVDKAKGDEKVWLRRRVAALSADRLGRADDAVSQLREILAKDPTDADAISSLERLYKQDKRHVDLKNLYLHRIEHAKDDSDKWVVLAELAKLEEHTLADPASAATRYRAILEIDSTDDEALAALDRLALSGERWEELADVLRRRLARAADAAARGGISMRLGHTLFGKLGDPRGALDTFASVLGDPGARGSHADAVAALEQLSTAHPTLGLEAGRLLEGAYEESGAWDKLARVLEQRLASTTDESDRRALRLRLAEVQGGKLGDHTAAYAVLESAFLDRPGDQELWDRLADAADQAKQHEQLVAAYSMAIEDAKLAPGDAADLAVRVARLYDDVLGRAEDAEPFHKRVLTHDPMDERAFLALKELFTTKERWDELQVLYRNRIAQTVDPDAKLDLLLQVCFLFEELLNDPELAIRAYQDVLELRSDNETARRALERLYAQTHRWRDLVALLRNELGMSGVDTLGVTFQLGQIHELRLAEHGAAVDQYEAVLQEQPIHEGAREALERLLTEPSQRQRVAAILEPLYERRASWGDLTRVLEVQLEDVNDPGGRLALLVRIAELHEQRLGDPVKAFDAYARAVRADATDTQVRRELARLADLRRLHVQRAEVLEAVIAQTDSDSLRAELLSELAELWDEKEGDPERTENAYERLIAADPHNGETVLRAARVLERIHLGKGDNAKLAVDLRRQIDLETDDESRKRLLVRLGVLLEEILEDVPGAIAAHRQRVELDGGDVDALRSLERLYERSGDWTSLIGVLQQRDPVTPDEGERRELARRIAQIQQDKLGDRDAAIASYNDLLGSFGQDRATLASLAALYESAGKWEDLLEVLTSDQALVADPLERASIRFRAGELLREKLGQRERAIEAYAEVLDAIPEHDGALLALEAIAQDEGATLDERVAAARTLVPRYESAQAYEKLLAALDVVARSEDASEKLRSLRRGAEVAELGLSDASRAFEWQSRAVRAGAGEPDVAGLVQDLERLAGASDKWDALVLFLMEAAPEILDADVQTDVHGRIAHIARTRLGDAQTARTYFHKVLEQRPEDPAALDALEELDAEVGDFRGLLEILRRKAEVASIPEARLMLLLQQAEIAEQKLEDVRVAIEAYEQVLSESDRREAYEGLERLYAKAERWSDLGAMFERQLEKGVGDPVDVHFKLGDVQQRRLDDTRGALDHYRAAVQGSGSHAPTIAALEGLLEAGEFRAEAAEILEPVYLARLDWPKVVVALEARLAAEQDVENRKKLLARLGAYHEDQREDTDAALETYARLFREDVADETVWDTLGRLARALGNRWDRIAEVFGKALDEVGVDEPATAKLALHAGRVHEERTGDLDKAADLYRRALKFDPTNPEPFVLVESVYSRQGKSDALLGLYREQVDVAADDGQRIALLHKIARIHEQLGASASAIQAYREILEIDPREANAAQSLDRLLLADQKWDEVADHLRHRIDQSLGAPDELELRYRLGEVLATRLDDKTGAIDVYEEILQANPAHRPTIGALEVLVQDVDHRLRVIQLLEPIYQREGEWRKLIAVYGAQIELTPEPEEKVRILGEIAQLHEQRGRDGSLAFSAWARAFELEPANEDVRAQVDRLAEAVGLWDEHVQAYERALAATDDAVVVSQLLATIARVHDEKRGDPRSSITTYERLLKHDEQDPTALDALEGLQAMVGDWEGLVDVFKRKVERSYDAAERGGLLRRAGEVLEELIGDREGAISLYTRALGEDDTDELALDALDRLYTSAANHEGLFGVLKRRVELAQDPALRVELGLRLGALSEERLGRFEDAIEAFQNVLNDQPGETTAVLSLARLYERRGMWSELLDNLKLQAGMADGTATRVALLHRAAEILERELDDVNEALSLYSEVLSLDPAFEPSRGALMRITNLEDYRARAAEVLEPLLRQQLRWDDLGTLLERTSEAMRDSLEKRAELRRLADVHERGRGDLAQAFEAYRRALAEDPGDEETLNDLERLAEPLNAWDKVADTFASRASSLSDPTQARALFVRLARIAELRLGDDARAVEAYSKAAEQTGDDEETLTALDRLYVKLGEFRKLAEVLERRVALGPEPTEAAALLNRLGAIREEQFQDLAGAFGAYREVIERDPSEPTALAALERLVADPSLAVEVIEVLDGAYRQIGAMEKVAQLFDRKLVLADSNGDRVRLLQEVAAVYEQDLGQPGQALEMLRRAFELDPQDESLLGELERLAPVSGSFEPLRGLVEKVTAGDRLDRILRRDLHLRAVRWYLDYLADPQAAEQQLRAAIGAERDTPEAHEQLVAILRAPGRTTELVVALRAWAEVENDETTRKDRLREAAEIAESGLSDVTTAAACYESILQVDAGDPGALDALIRIRGSESKWKEVADLLAKRIDVESEPEARVALRHQLAALWAGALNDAEEAISAYRAVLDEDATDLRAIQALEDLFEKAKRWKDYQEMIERRLDIAETSEQRIAAKVRLARLQEQQFGKRAEAIEQLRDILLDDPGNADALDELERLLAADSKWDELVELLERRIGDAAAAGQLELELGALVRLADLHETRRKDPAQAIAILERILERDATHVAALRALVRLHKSAKDVAKTADALERLLHVLSGADKVSVAHELAELADVTLKDTDRAEGALRSVYAEGGADTHERLKKLYEKASKFGELAQLLSSELAATTDPKAKVAALRHIAKLYAEKLGDPGTAATYLEQAVQLTPDDRDVLLPLCDLYIAAGRQRDAVPVLEKIIGSYGGKRVKEVAQFHHRLGLALEGLGELAGAIAQFDAANKIDLTSVAIQRDYGKLAYKQGDYVTAQKMFRALLLQKIDPAAGITKADVYFYIGDMSAKQGDKPKAISMLDRALAEDKQHAEAKALLAQLKG